MQLLTPGTLLLLIEASKGAEVLTVIQVYNAIGYVVEQ